MPIAPRASSSPYRGLHIGLWMAQIVLALAFGIAGFMKLTQPIALLAANMIWPGDLPAAFVRFIGACEVLGAIGLVLPATMRVKPGLTPLAAAGLLSVMMLAVPFHISRGEWAVVPVNAVLGALAAFVGWGRSRKAPLATK
jgi:putative oxidoreductase